MPNCIDQNECDTANGGCSQNCMNTEGSFYCTCNAGYKLNVDKLQCDDIHECTADSPKNGGCSQVCITLLGPTLAHVTNLDMFCLMWMVDLATPFSLQMMETGQEMFIILDIAVFVETALSLLWLIMQC